MEKHVKSKHDYATNHILNVGNSTRKITQFIKKKKLHLKRMVVEGSVLD